MNHESDSLVVSREVHCELQISVTQRTVLSFISSVIPPIGLVAPYTVRARLLLKFIWRITGMIPCQKHSKSNSMSGIQACLS